VDSREKILAEAKADRRFNAILSRGEIVHPQANQRFSDIPHIEKARESVGLHLIEGW